MSEQTLGITTFTTTAKDVCSHLVRRDRTIRIRFWLFDLIMVFAICRECLLPIAQSSYWKIKFN